MGDARLQTDINNKAVREDYELSPKRQCHTKFFAWMFPRRLEVKEIIDRKYWINIFEQKRAAESGLHTLGVKVTMCKISVHTCMKFGSCISLVHLREIPSPTHVHVF